MTNAAARAAPAAPWDNDDDVKLPENLPLPIFWRLLILPIKPKTMSKGGIELPSQAQDAQLHLNYVGKVVAMGDLAYRSERFVGQIDFPKVGDYVIYGKYAGQPMLFKGLRFIMVNDDEVLGIVKDPNDLTIYV